MRSVRMTPRHLEIQLGHLCNDRCVFCISGRRTSQGRAPLVATEGVLQTLRDGWAAGHRTVTLLGGEPTIQPVFMPAVRTAVALGFEKIVVFSNGSKTGRTDLMDEVLATGGRFEWRFSVHGATREAHERTTGRRGSFDQLMASIARAHARGQDITTNTCVVTQNHGSLAHLGPLLAPYGIRHAHVDMIHPADTGNLTDEVLRTMVPRYTDIVGDLDQMLAGFPTDVPVSIGNLPYCVAPHLAPWIHHAGEDTRVVTVDDDADGTLHPARDKYRRKHAGSYKPAACRACVFDTRCRGFFDDYRVLHGLDELRPVTAEDLRATPVTPSGAVRRIRGLVDAALAGWTPPAPFTAATVATVDARGVHVQFHRPVAAPVQVVLLSDRGGVAAGPGCGLHPELAPGDPAVVLSVLRAFWTRVVSVGLHSDHPPGPDAVGLMSPALTRVIARLRSQAPFGELSWVSLTVDPDGHRAELTLRSPVGEEAVAWVGHARDGHPPMGYRVTSGPHGESPTVGGTVSDALRTGLGAWLKALRSLPVVPPDPG